jgi:hypothetical protein
VAWINFIYYSKIDNILFIINSMLILGQGNRPGLPEYAPEGSFHRFFAGLWKSVTGKHGYRRIEEKLTTGSIS